MPLFAQKSFLSITLTRKKPMVVRKALDFLSMLFKRKIKSFCLFIFLLTRFPEEKFCLELEKSFDLQSKDKKSKSFDFQGILLEMLQDFQEMEEICKKIVKLLIKLNSRQLSVPYKDNTTVQSPFLAPTNVIAVVSLFLKRKMEEVSKIQSSQDRQSLFNDEQSCLSMFRDLFQLLFVLMNGNEKAIESADNMRLVLVSVFNKVIQCQVSGTEDLVPAALQLKESIDRFEFEHESESENK